MTLFQVDAFTDRLFGGNPAAVVPLESWPADDLLQAIAAENNLSETAFFVPRPDGVFHLRWFTPTTEVRMCGHATLATGHVFYHHLGYSRPLIEFDALCGRLTVARSSDGYRLDFPADTPVACDTPEHLQLALGLTPLEVFQGTDDFLVIVEQEDDVIRLQPDFERLRLIEGRGVLVSAPGSTADFVSRCFFPNFGIDEDPVTGSAHTLLTPYWAHRLGKTELTAQQLSRRGGRLRCTLHNDRVWLDGHAVTYSIGEIVGL